MKKNRVIGYWHKKLHHQIHGRVNNFVSNFAGINADRKANTQEGHAANLLGSQPSRIFLRELSADMYSDIQAICTDNNLSIMSVLSGIFMIIPWLFGEVRPTLIASPMTNRIKKDTRELIGHLTGAIYM